MSTKFDIKSVQVICCRFCFCEKGSVPVLIGGTIEELLMQDKLSYTVNNNNTEP